MYATSLCDLHLSYRLEALSPLFVGSGDTEEHASAGRIRATRVVQGNKKSRLASEYELTVARHDPVQHMVSLPLHRTDGKQHVFFVPASSLRGAFRHFLGRRIDRAVRDRVWRPAFTLEPAGAELSDDEARDASLLHERFGNLMVRQLFGTERRSGALRFTDATVPRSCSPLEARYSDMGPQRVTGAQYGPPLRILTQNKLDRFTMASTSGLRTIAPLEVGTTLNGSVTLRNFGWWQVGALGFAMHALREGEITLGARSAIGLGRVSVTLKELTIRYHDIANVDENATVLPGVGKILEKTRLPTERVTGTFSDRDGVERRLFHIDPDDQLDCGQPTNFAEHFLTSERTYDGAQAERILREATARFAAAARQLTQSAEAS